MFGYLFFRLFFVADGIIPGVAADDATFRIERKHHQPDTAGENYGKKSADTDVTLEAALSFAGWAVCEFHNGIISFSRHLTFLDAARLPFCACADLA